MPNKKTAWDELPTVPSHKNTIKFDDIPTIRQDPFLDIPVNQSKDIPATSEPQSTPPHKYGEDIFSPVPKEYLPDEATQTKNATQSAYEGVGKSVMENQDLLPENERKMVKNSTSLDAQHPITSITDIHGDPATTGSFGQSVFAKLEQQKQKAIADAGYNNPYTAAGSSDVGQRNIAKEYEDKIAQARDNFGHIVGLQLFSKELSPEVVQSKMTKQASSNALSLIDKQEHDDVRLKQLNDMLEKDKKTRQKGMTLINKEGDNNEFGQVMTGAEFNDAKRELESIRNKYNKDRIDVKNQTQWDNTRMGLEYEALLGDPQAIEDKKRFDAGLAINPKNKLRYDITGAGIIDNGIKNVTANGQHQVAENVKPHIVSKEQIESDNQGVFNEQRLQDIGDLRYKTQNPWNKTLHAIIPQQKATKEDLEEYGKAIGLNDEQIAKLKPEDIPSQATLLGQGAKSFLNAPGSLYEFPFRAAAAVGLANKDAVNERFAPGWEQERGLGSMFAQNMPHEQSSMSDPLGVIGHVVEGVGGLGGFITTAGVVGRGIKGMNLINKGSKLVSGYEELKGAEYTSKLAETTEKYAVNTTMFMQGYNDAYKNSFDVIGKDDTPTDEAKRQLYAMVNGGMTAAIFSISPKTGILKNILGENTKETKQIVEELANEGTAAFKNKDWKEKVISAIVAGAKENGKQVSLAVASQAFTNLENMFSSKTNNYDATDHLKETAITTAVSMLIPSIVSGVMHPINQTPINKGLMYEMGNNPDKYTSEISKLVSEGKMSESDAKTATDAINKMVGIVKSVPTDDGTNNEALKADDKISYAWADLQTKLLEDKKRGLPEGDARIKRIDEALKQSNNIKQEILDKVGKRVEENVAISSVKGEEEETSYKEEKNSTDNSEKDISLESKGITEPKTKKNEEENVRTSTQEHGQEQQTGTEVHSEANSKGGDEGKSGDRKLGEQPGAEIPKENVQQEASTPPAEPILKKKRRKITAEEPEEVKPVENASTQSEEQQQKGNQPSSVEEHARVEQAGSEETPTSAESGDSNIGSEAQKKINNKFIPQDLIDKKYDEVQKEIDDYESQIIKQGISEGKSQEEAFRKLTDTPDEKMTELLNKRDEGHIHNERILNDSIKDVLLKNKISEDTTNKIIKHYFDINPDSDLIHFFNVSSDKFKEKISEKNLPELATLIAKDRLNDIGLDYEGVYESNISGWSEKEKEDFLKENMLLTLKIKKNLLEEITSKYETNDVGTLKNAIESEKIRDKEIVEEKPRTSQEQPIESFVTSKGSIYKYLPDGRTQRYKTVEGKEHDPQDLTSFVKFSDPDQEQRFLSGIQESDKSNTKVYLIDKTGRIYDTNEEAKGKDVKLALVNPKTGEVIETAKTSMDPQKGYQVFDQRRFKEGEHKFREKHIGNEITEINYKKETKEKPLEKKESETHEDKIKSIDLQLQKERASQKLEAQLREKAEKDKDIEKANKHNENWYKKKDKIEKLEDQKSEVLKDAGKEDREDSIKKSYNNFADKLEQKYEANKKAHKGEALSSILGISTKIGDHIADFVVARAIEGIRELGDIHVAIDRAIRLAREKFGKEAEDLSKEDNQKIHDHLLGLGQKNPDIDHEPVLPIDHEEYAKDILADIRSGDISLTEATKEIRDEIIENREGKPLSEPVQENNKAKILKYIKWHIQNDATSIVNETTRLRRTQLGLGDELPTLKKEFGETWEEAKDKIEQNPQLPHLLIEELSKKARPLTDVENAIILHQQNTKEIELQKQNDNINNAAESGDAGALIEAKVTKARVLDELHQIYNINKAVGTENARGLASRRMMVDRKYSLVNMISEKRATANDGKPLTEQQETQIEGLHKKIKDTQEAFDNYVKGAESQIIDLQRKAISGQLKDKKSASSKLREWADNIEKANKNQAYSSPIPITPKMIADGMRVIAHGLDKGEEIVELVKRAIENIRASNKGIDENNLEKELNKAIIDSGIFEPTPARREAKDKSELFTNGKLDREAVRLKVEADRAKAQYDINLKRDQDAQLSKMAKAQNLFVKWQRAFKLSNPITMGKLMMAAFTRLTTTPLEDIVGGAYSRLLPQLAKGAIGEGGGLNINEIVRAYKEGIMRGLKDSGEILSRKNQGKSELDVLFGKASELPPEAIDFFGQLHSAVKAPVKRFIFERSLERRLRRTMATGVDITDPMVQTSVLLDAYKDANRAIFMQDNKVAEGWNKLVHHFEKEDPKTGEAPYKGIATTLQWLAPFVKVPTNIAAEIGTNVYGIPVGAAKLIHATFTKGIEGLSGDEKDIILRNLKKGTLGAAALALGYFNPKNFGGYYQPGQKRDDKDAEAMGLKLFDTKIPAWFVESPIYQAMQIGATVRRIKEQKVHGEEKGIGEGIWAGASGLAQSVPLVGQPIRMGQLFHSQRDRDYYVGELAKSTVDPAIISYLAKVTDPADEGSVARKILNPENNRKTPKTIMEHIKSGIPFLREDLPEKHRKHIEYEQ